MVTPSIIPALERVRQKILKFGYIAKLSLKKKKKGRNKTSSMRVLDTKGY
jgi:hypothetical protein